MIVASVEHIQKQRNDSTLDQILKMRFGAFRCQLRNLRTFVVDRIRCLVTTHYLYIAGISGESRIKYYRWKAHWKPVIFHVAIHCRVDDAKQSTTGFGFLLSEKTTNDRVVAVAVVTAIRYI